MILTPGIDISAANGSVDFELVHAAGKRFVYFKATEGEHYTDPVFAASVDRASNLPFAGLGAYCFQHPDLDSTSQAVHFCDITDHVTGKLKLAPWLDLEVREHQSAQQIVDHVGAWFDAYVKRRGSGIVLYSFLSFVQSLIKELGGPTSAGALELVKFPLALAAYTTVPVEAPKPWTTWTFHQWAASAPGGPIGSCPGVIGAVDLSNFNGSEEDLAWVLGN